MLTITELVNTAGGGTHTNVGLATGGAVKAIIPPAAIGTAGIFTSASSVLPVVGWFLDALKVAQDTNNVGPPATLASVINRKISIRGTTMTTTYTVVLETEILSTPATAPDILNPTVYTDVFQ